MSSRSRALILAILFTCTPIYGLAASLTALSFGIEQHNTTTVASNEHVSIFLDDRVVSKTLDASGTFRLRLKQGDYPVSVSYLGHDCRTVVHVTKSAWQIFTCSLDAKLLVPLQETFEPTATITYRGRSFVPFLSYAKEHHVAISKDHDVYSFVSDGSTLRLNTTDLRVYAGQEDIYHLVALPITRHGILYLAQDDAESLIFDAPSPQTSTLASTGFTSHQIVDEQRVQAHKIAQLTKKDPTEQRLGSHVAIALTVLDQGVRSHQLEITGNGSTFHGYLGLYGQGDLADTTFGTLTIGSSSSYLLLGQPQDPLTGAVFLGQATAGFIYQPVSSSFSLFDLSRNQSGRILGVIEHVGSLTRILAINQNHLQNSLLGFTTTQITPTETTIKEFWLSPHGVGLGFSHQSQGRLFLETQDAIMLGRLPVASGDLQNHIAIGYHLSPGFTIASGYTRGFDEPSSAYANATLHNKTSSLTFFVSKSDTSGFLYTHNDHGYASLAYDTSDHQGTWQVDAGLHTNSGDLHISGFSSTTSDLTGTWQFPGRFAPVLGYESTSDGVSHRQGIIYGIHGDLTQNLGLEVDNHPSTQGRTFRVTVTQRLFFPERQPREDHLIRLFGPSDVQFHLYLDNTDVGTMLAAATHTLTAHAPTQTIVIRTLDNTYSTIPQTVGTAPAIDLTARPVKTIRGSIIINDPGHLLPSSLHLDGFELILSNGLATAISNQQGQFIFPSIPIEPTMTVSINPETLPPGVSSLPIKPDVSGQVVLVLTPSALIQKTIFK